MTPLIFTSPDQSHGHSLQTLQTLFEYDDFMDSIQTMADMGCGHGLDTEWWATRTTRDDARLPLNIKCTGVDLLDNLPMAAKHRHVTYCRQDFEEIINVHKKKFDIIWCHDAFQYAINPFQTLANWRKVMSKESMLILILPQTTNMEFNTQAFDQRDGVYYNWTMVSLIHVLAVSGFDCANGFFLKQPDDPWLHAVVYNSNQPVGDPKITRWYNLVDSALLPESACVSIRKYGYLRQRDLVLPWLDKSLHGFAKH